MKSIGKFRFVVVLNRYIHLFYFFILTFLPVRFKIHLRVREENVVLYLLEHVFEMK